MHNTSPQQLASNPNTSCWVNASAGSGKTKVLIDRIIRLLLVETNPTRILCLTFSRAAAGEMQQRLACELKKLAYAKDTDLEKYLSNLGEEATVKNINMAKQLYSLIKNNPVVIQTVHSFCQTLLMRQVGNDILQQPSRVMENFEELTYLHQAFNDLVEDPSATTTIEEFLNFHGDGILFEYLCKTTKNVTFLSFEDVKRRLCELFDVNELPKFPFPKTPIHPFIKGLLNQEPPTLELSKEHTFIQCFLTQKSTVRAKILPASIQKQYPEAETLLKIYAEELASFYVQKNRYDQLQKSLHFWQLQQLFISHYQKIKQERNLWDFHDLIEKTLQTLKLDAFDQILLDLNYRIDHILVDEAQDTSISQWQVIEHLVQGLFHQNSNHRSVFVVGDEKQSIYSFQGSDIRMYKQMQKLFSSICSPWININLSTSYRSGKKILKLVDEVFEKNPHGMGDNYTKHENYHAFDGCIEVLPAIETVEKTVDPWPIFTEYSQHPEPEELLAEQVISHLKNKLNNNLFLQSQDRHSTWGDVMILMRKRGKLMQTFTSFCENQNINYSAYDPKNLMDTLVVRDLLSAVEFMLMPQNDLNLAALLKSPCMREIGFISEDDLFKLCHNRQSSLWDEVQAHHKEHAKKLQELIDSSPATSYDYFTHACTLMNIKCEFIDSFLDEVFKRYNLLKLGIRELVNHLHTYPAIFTKTMATNSLQLSTIHGSKGLEAPIVVIVDNGDEPSIKQDILLYDPVANFWFLKPPLAADTILTAALKEHHQKALDFEYNRLFYVALTRAKEYIICAGLENPNRTDSWYCKISDGKK